MSPTAPPDDRVPTIGADCHYRSYGTPGGEYSARCRAAKITEVGGWQTTATLDEHESDEIGPRRRTLEQVWLADLCAVTVFNPTGFFLNQVIPHAPIVEVSGELVAAGGTWHWPIPECDER